MFNTLSKFTFECFKIFFFFFVLKIMCFDGFNRHPLIIESIFCTHTHKHKGAQTFFTILFSYKFTKFIFSYFFYFEEWETKNDWLIDWVRTKRQKKLSLKWGEQGCSTQGCFGLCCKVYCSKYALVGHNTSQSQLMVNLKYF